MLENFSARDAIKSFLQPLDKPASAQELLKYGRFVAENCKGIETLNNHILPIIEELNLGDISFSYECLQSTNKVVRWFGIGVLKCKQAYYSKHDLFIINKILAEYDMLFPIRAQVLDSGRHIVCQCGKKYASNVLVCPSCAESRYGYLKFGQFELESLKEDLFTLRGALEQLVLLSESENVHLS